MCISTFRLFPFLFLYKITGIASQFATEKRRIAIHNIALGCVATKKDLLIHFIHLKTLLYHCKYLKIDLKSIKLLKIQCLLKTATQNSKSATQVQTMCSKTATQVKKVILSLAIHVGASVFDFSLDPGNYTHLG